VKPIPMHALLFRARRTERTATRKYVRNFTELEILPRTLLGLVCNIKFCCEICIFPVKLNKCF